MNSKTSCQLLIIVLWIFYPLSMASPYSNDDRTLGGRERGPGGSYSVDQLREQMNRQTRMQAEIANTKSEMRQIETRITMPAYLANPPVLFRKANVDSSFNFKLTSFYDNLNQNGSSQRQNSDSWKQTQNNQTLSAHQSRPDTQIQYPHTGTVPESKTNGNWEVTAGQRNDLTDLQRFEFNIDQYKIDLQLDKDGRIQNEAQTQIEISKNGIEQFKGMDVLGILPRSDVQGYELLVKNKFEPEENLKIPIAGLVVGDGLSPDVMNHRMDSIQPQARETFQSIIKIHQEGDQYVLSGEKTALALVMIPPRAGQVAGEGEVLGPALAGSKSGGEDESLRMQSGTNLQLNHIELALTPESKLIVQSKTEFPGQNLRVEIGRLWVNKEGALIPEEGTIYSPAAAAPLAGRQNHAGLKLRLNGALEDIRIKSMDQNKKEFVAVIEKFRKKDGDVRTGKLTAPIELKGKMDTYTGRAYLSDGEFVGGRMEDGVHAQPVLVRVTKNNFTIVKNLKSEIETIDKELSDNRGGRRWHREWTPRIEKLEAMQAQINEGTRILPEKLSFNGLYNQTRQEAQETKTYANVFTDPIRKETWQIVSGGLRAVSLALYPGVAVENGVKTMGQTFRNYTGRLFGGEKMANTKAKLESNAALKVEESKPEIKSAPQEDKNLPQKIKNASDDRLALTSPADYFSQGEGWWAKTLMDHTKSYVKDTGCAITVGAMVVNFFSNAFPELGISKTDPGKLNQSLIKLEKNGFDEYHDLEWGALEIISNGKVEVLRQKKIKEYPLQQLEKFIDQDLKNNKPVAIQVPRIRDGKVGKHWLLIIGKENGKFKIYDPGSKKVSVYEPYTTMERKLSNGKTIKVTYGPILKIQQFEIWR